jgi:hypothetical protein
MKRPAFRSLLVLSTSILAASVLWVAGCSRDNAPTAPTTGSPYSMATASMVVRMDDPGVRAAIGAQNRATPGLMGNGIIGTGVSVDEKGKPVIVVYTERVGVGVPRQIEGIATRTLVTGPVVPYRKPGGGGPLQMGTSTGNDNECASGTLSCVVTKGGSDYFLSNNHVFARENAASVGERIDAPGRYDGHPICAQTPQIGTLAAYQRINFGGSNTVDCAIAQPSSGLSYSAVEAGGYTPASTTAAAAVGLAVKKTGRTSGLTHATIQAVNVTIQVGYSAGTATFTGQIQTPGNFIRSGDSGSLMVTETGNNPVGLCFAGSSQASFANPIGPVLQALAVSLK